MREPSFPPPPPPRPPSLFSAHTPNEATFLRVDFSQKQTQKGEEEEEEEQSFAPLRCVIVAQWRLNFAWASGFFCAKSSCVLDRERCHLIKMGGVSLEHQSPEEIIVIGQDHPHPSRRIRKRRLKRIEKLRTNIRDCEGGGWQDPVFLCEFGFKKRSKNTRKKRHQIKCEPCPGQFESILPHCFA